MKAFKGCINSDCSAYKKTHYKDEDRFCTKCGKPLSYVCADCWKAFETNTLRYCDSCEYLREQKKAKRVAKFKDGGKQVAEVATTVGAIATAAAKNAPKIKGAASNIAKIIKK